jgi:hypothetical protein
MDKKRLPDIKNRGLLEKKKRWRERTKPGDGKEGNLVRVLRKGKSSEMERGRRRRRSFVRKSYKEQKTREALENELKLWEQVVVVIMLWSR